ncbi:MAG: hypothetical protein KF696_10105 [Planctomycetes bacterium]|nr:hypothetical protein [Planctomycetota bacterium]MCW8136210.1 hypothetical protein [Planctomycetota bacterium]
MAGNDQSLMPDDAFGDPELGFGEDDLVALPLDAPVHDVQVDVDVEPSTLAEDANVPLDVEPDPVIPESEVFTDAAPSLDDEQEDAEVEDVDARQTIEMQAVRAELQGIADERDQLAARVRELTDKLEAAAPAGEITRLEAALAEAREFRRQAEEQASALRRENADLHERLVQAEAAALPPAEPEPDEASRDDLVQAQLTALQSENAQLKEALKEAQAAEARAELAHDELRREIEGLQQQLTSAELRLEEGADAAARMRAESEELGRELALARKQVADVRDAGAAVERGAKELDDRRAELDQLARALADARTEVERLTPFEKEAERVIALEDRITELQQQLLAREKEAAEAQEKLDTEAARSYRLSQRRIPALNKEIEDAQEHNRELERKLQKAELKANTFEDQVRELTEKLGDLERALQGAKARAQDTAIIQPQDADANALVSDEVRRLTNRLREVEAERTRLTERVKMIDAGQKDELKRLSERADRLETESDERFDNLLKQRTQLRVLRERINGMLRLAEDLGKADRDMGKTLLDAIKKLADLPPDIN